MYCSHMIVTIIVNLHFLPFLHLYLFTGRAEYLCKALNLGLVSLTAGLEMFRKSFDFGQAGDTLGALKREEV